MNWGGAVVGARLMTYGEAQSKWPQLAAASSAVVDPSRQVWVMTKYYSTPIAVPWGGDPAQGTVKISQESVVVDAATGQETDASEGLSAVPSS
jgi:hypothetical protein